jgi:hypothetical protein
MDVDWDTEWVVRLREPCVDWMILIHFFGCAVY